jgi:hypothetical protein
MDDRLLAPAAVAHVDWKLVEQARSANQAAASALYEQRRLQGARGVVLLITSQHPLVENPATGLRDWPGVEYLARLDQGLELASTWQSQGRPLTVITLGDLHRDDAGVPDDCPLAEAGQRYLREHGLPAELLLNAETVAQQRQEGIYCTEDEVAVAADALTRDPRMGLVVAVCGQAQAQRVLLAGQNCRVPLQVNTPLVFEGDQLADPATFHHEAAFETLHVTPLDVAAPHDPRPFLRLREVVKQQRR